MHQTLEIFIKSALSALITSLALNFRLKESDFVFFACLAFSACLLTEGLRAAIAEDYFNDERFFFSELAFPIVLMIVISGRWPVRDLDEVVLNAAGVIAVVAEGAIRIGVSDCVGAVAFDLCIASLVFGICLKLYASWTQALQAQRTLLGAITARLVISGHTNVAHLLVLTGFLMHEVFWRANEAGSDLGEKEMALTEEPLMDDNIEHANEA